MKRRDFLKAGSASLAASVVAGSGLISWAPRAQAATINKTFFITDGYQNQITGDNVYFRGFSSSNNVVNVPGESIVAQEGDTLNITITNTLSSTHRFVIDGVVNSGDIRPGRTVTVSFTPTQAGTYMYYDNSNAPYNRLLGLHGGFAVMPAGSDNQLFAGSQNTFVQQQFWIFHDIDPVWHNTLANGNTPNTAYEPRFFTLNGLGGRPPGAPGAHDPNIDAMTDPRSAVHGHIGDRTLLRSLNAGKCDQSLHCHGNHMEWLSANGEIRPDVWKKDCIYLDKNNGIVDVIFPFETPPDAYPPVSTGIYPMHLHSEMSQTAGGGFYMFGSLTDIYFE
ncbi:MAG: multicopper oxidase domain-containing protein [Gammaproteobacteria bacterium]|nr:multicopper oxidase domain-containing protein [Gammaproteobacteria bacterium]